MNKEDKIRLARYMKGYIPNDDINNIDNMNETSKKNKIGFIEKIDINKNILINDIISVSSNK
jgi:hypothetical protein